MYCVGKVLIPMFSDPYGAQLCNHAIRAVGCVTQGLAVPFLPVHTAVPVASVPNAASFGPFFALLQQAPQRADLSVYHGQPTGQNRVNCLMHGLDPGIVPDTGS